MESDDHGYNRVETTKHLSGKLGVDITSIQEALDEALNKEIQNAVDKLVKEALNEAKAEIIEEAEFEKVQEAVQDALDEAVMGGHLEVIKYLVKRCNADISGSEYISVKVQ